MKLSECPAQSPSFRVVRDGAFASVGFVSYETDALLVFIESEAYLPELVANARVTAVITNEALVDKIPVALAVAVSDNPRLAFYTLHNNLTETDFYWTSFDNEIDPSSKVHPRAYLADKNIRVGKRCVIEPNVTIHERTIIGDDVIIRAGTVIGSEGNQFIYAGEHLMGVKHAGGVRIADRVEIQSNTCVDMAVFGGFTEIGEECKIDNLVHIAHNVKLGKRNRVIAHAMIAGSVISGDDVWFGPCCAVSDGLKVGSRASVSLGAVVTRDVPEDARVSGNFAIEHGKFIAHMKSIR